MKSVTVHLPDDVYERAERRAADHGLSLSHEVAELVKVYGAADANKVKIVPAAAKDASGVEGRNQELAATLAELTALADDCRSANWDGREAAAVCPETIRNASAVVKALPRELPMPSIGVEPDGQITLEWYRHPRWLLSVSVSPDSDLYYAALFDANDSRGRERFIGTIPETILSLIRRVVAE